MRFLNVRRTVLPSDLTLPVTAQTTGNKAAGFFTGWDSGITNVFNSGALGGAKALQEVNGDGRIAVKSTASWRDCEVTAYGGPFYTMLRLTDAGRGFLIEYNPNVSGGGLIIQEQIGINPALPIAPIGNGTTIRQLHTEPGTMVSKYGPGGSVVDAGYTTAYAPGHTMTFGVVGTRFYVKFKGILIIDLPYEAWTHMAHGKVALAPSTAYGLIDSSVDFMPLVSTLSDYSNPTAPVLRMEDFDLREIRQTGCSIAAGSTTLTVPSTTPWRVGDKGIIEIGQVVCTVTPGGSNVGNGFFVVGTPFLSTDDAQLGTWATGTWTVTFTSATSYTVTRPGGAAGGTGLIDRRYNNGLTFQIMDGGTWGLDAHDRMVRTGRVQFAAGDTFTIVCAATGETSTATFDGRPAAGRNRTIGVGGNKPVQSITTAQRLASTNLGYLANTLTYVSDNVDGNQGRVYYVGPGGASYADISGVNDYYGNKLRPQALKFTVAAILSPTTMQISTPAVAATANATVWIDSSSALLRVLGSNYMSQNGVYENVTVRIPAGHYTLSAAAGDYLTRKGWKFQGAGMDVTNFYQLRGVDGVFLAFTDWHDGGDEAIADFTVWGNDHPNGGWGLADLANPNATTGNLPNFVTVKTSVNTSLNRVKIVNSRGPSLAMSFGRGTSIRNCVSLKTVPSLNYSGWMINVSDGNDADLTNDIIDCTMINSWLQGALETFANDYATLSGFNMINGVLSTNSSSEYTISNGTFRFTKNSQFNTEFAVGTQALAVLSNQLHTEEFGGTIANVNFLYEGFLNEANDMHVSLSMELSPSPGVSVSGTYNPLVARTGSERGLISRPDYIGPDASHSPAIVISESELTLTNYRIIGASSGGFPQISNQQGIITANNNIRESGPSGPGTNNQTGNVTNAVYDAL